MIEVGGNIAYQPIVILIDLGSNNSVVLNLVERFHLKKSKHDKS